MLPDWWVPNLRWELRAKEVLLPGNESRGAIPSLTGGCRVREDFRKRSQKHIILLQPVRNILLVIHFDGDADSAIMLCACVCAHTHL